MKTAPDFLRPFVGPEPGPYLAYLDAVAAVQAVIDHYDPLPGKLALAYRVVESPVLASPILSQRFLASFSGNDLNPPF